VCLQLGLHQSRIAVSLMQLRAPMPLGGYTAALLGHGRHPDAVGFVPPAAASAILCLNSVHPQLNIDQGTSQPAGPAPHLQYPTFKGG
jgi:hypothetical protein